MPPAACLASADRSHQCRPARRPHTTFPRCRGGLDVDHGALVARREGARYTAGRAACCARVSRTTW